MITFGQIKTTRRANLPAGASKICNSDAPEDLQWLAENGNRATRRKALQKLKRKAANRGPL